MSAGAKTAPRIPPMLAANPRLDRWLRFNDDGQTVTVYTGRVELGQGIITAMAQIAAEELDLAFDQVRIVGADTELTPDEGHTSGSRSIPEGGWAMRVACAEARAVLLAAAATRLDLPADRLVVERGRITGADRIRDTSYWSLPHAELLAREATGQVPVKPAARYTVVGRSAPRLDIPDKVRGRPRFVADMVLPGMLHGRVARPPSFGARLVAFDDAPIRALPGVLAVVRDGDFIGVVAEREEQAVKARKAMIAAARWSEPGLPTDAHDIHHFIESRTTTDSVIMQREDAAAAARAATTLEARFTRPYIAHASLGPSCALATFDGSRIEVWTHSQGVYPLQRELAQVFDLPIEAVTAHHVDGPGCYGHNGADDAALDAALLARAVPGRPVMLQWMREDEFAWEPLGPAMVVKTRASLDATGHVVDWSTDIWSNGHTQRPGVVVTTEPSSSLLAAWHLAQPVARMPQGDPAMAGGGGIARNGEALYDFPNQKVVAHRVEELPLRVSTLRALGAYANVFAIESFMDELARSAGADPVEFRLRHMKDPRARAVIELAAEKAGWHAGRPTDGTGGRGIAFAQYKNGYGYLAIVVEVVLEPEFRVTRAVAAVDVGLAINPDGIINQTEGGILQSLSWTLKEAVMFDRERITSRDWETYPVLTFSEVPQVEVHLIDRPDQIALGAGETPTGPTAAAVANALADALGVRVYDLPLTRERIIAAIG
jgi:nicotinate dehydrogenase subunit B